MRRRNLAFIGCLSVVAGAILVEQDTVHPDVAPPRPDGEGVGLGAEPPIWNVGLLSPGATATRTFHIRNAGPEPVRILRIEEPCVCTTVDAEGVVIPSGSRAPIDVTFRATRPYGQRHVSLIVHSTGSRVRQLRVPVSAEVVRPPGPRPAVAPRTVDLGLKAPGETVDSVIDVAVSNAGSEACVLEEVLAPKGFTVIGRVPATIAPDTLHPLQLLLDGPAQSVVGKAVRLMFRAPAPTLSVRVRGALPPARRPRALASMAAGGIELVNTGSARMRVRDIVVKSGRARTTIPGALALDAGASCVLPWARESRPELLLIQSFDESEAWRVRVAEAGAVALLGDGESGGRPELFLGETRDPLGSVYTYRLRNLAPEPVTLRRMALDGRLGRVAARLIGGPVIPARSDARLEVRVTPRAKPGTLRTLGTLLFERVPPVPFVVTAHVRPYSPEECERAGARRIELYAVSEQLGKLAPCQCASGQHGGFPRLLGLVNAPRPRGRAPVLVQLGDFCGDDASLKRRKLETVLRMLRTAARTVVVPGEQELAMGVDTLRELERVTGVPIVATNVVDARTGVPVLSPFAVLEGGTRVGIVGIVAPEVMTTTDLLPRVMIRQPGEEVAAALNNIGPCDAMIALVYGRSVDVKSLLRNFPALSMVVCARAGDMYQQGARLAGRAIIETTKHGRLAAHVDLAVRSGTVAAATFEQTPIHDRIAADRSAVAVLQHYKARLQTLPSPPKSRGGLSYAGAATCATCHKSAHDIWARSKHARALDALARGGDEFDPDCLACHTVGFNRANGYRVGESPVRFADVQCESCHGPSAGHVADWRVRTPGSAREACTTCHTPEDSPLFDFNRYWSRIAHGK